MRGKIYYAKKPTPAAPCTVLQGPFDDEPAARGHLMDNVKKSEDDLPNAAPWGEYQLFRHIGTVRPVISHNVKLKTVE